MVDPGFHTWIDPETGEVSVFPTTEYPSIPVRPEFPQPGGEGPYDPNTQYDHPAPGYEPEPERPVNPLT